MKKILSIGDIHYPDQHTPTLSIFKQVVKDTKPDIIVFGGDEINADGISRFTAKTGMNGIHDTEKELKGFRKDIYNPIYKLAKKANRKVEFVNVGGNHFNQRKLDLLEKLEQKQEYGIAEYVRTRLDKSIYMPDCVMLEYNDFFKFGKLCYTHGENVCDNHAKKTVLTWGANVIYFHTHTAQLYTNCSKVNEPHQAISNPCACNRNPDYMKKRSNKWVNGFGVTYFDEDGNFWHYIINIIDNKTIFNNKVYNG